MIEDFYHNTFKDTGGSGGGAAVYILIIALIVCAGVAYRYWKKNYSNPPPEQPKSAPPAKTDTTPLSTTGTGGKNVMGWKPPGGDGDGPTPPKSFDNPVFREHHQQQEEIEADEFRPDELPPGMTMEDPRNPNSNKRRKSKRGENRYHDDHQDNHHHHDQGPARPNKSDRYKEFEIPEGIPQWDPSASQPTEMDSFEMGRHRVFDQMRSPAAGGPPNSMSMSRDYRQMYNDNTRPRDDRDKECIEIQRIDSYQSGHSINMERFESYQTELTQNSQHDKFERVESFQTELTEKTISRDMERIESLQTEMTTKTAPKEQFEFFSSDENESIYSYGNFK